MSAPKKRKAGRPPLPEGTIDLTMTFGTELRPLVDRVGGSTVAAEICGVSRQLVNLWLRGEGNPNASTKAGALLLLGKAKPKPPENRC